MARWRYIGTNEFHIGPFAEDFYSMFNTGIDNKHISTIDPSGVALLGIQQLKKNDDLQKNEIDSLKGLIVSLQNQINSCCSSNQSGMKIGNGGSSGISSYNTSGADFNNSSNDLSSGPSSVPMLYQNTPNPFNQQTNIQYFIPTSAQSASIMLFDLNGKLIKTIAVINFGTGSITINGNELTSGMYVYSLVVNGQIIDTKRMILTQ